MKFSKSVIYIVSILLINVSFEYIPPIELFDGTIWSLGSVLAGSVFISRDYAQREVGHVKVLFLMVIAGLISYLMTSPFIVVASISAFAISEGCDYLVYTFRKGSFKSKVITSGLCSVPVDTIVFLTLLDQLSWISFLVMTLSKFIALTWLVFRR